MGVFKASNEPERGQKEGAEIPGRHYPVISRQGSDPLCDSTADRLASCFLNFGVGLANNFVGWETQPTTTAILMLPKKKYWLNLERISCRRGISVSRVVMKNQRQL
jgi:hypothetical protein